MPNMHDYLRWRGDLTLMERMFNDVDNIILACLSYLDFTGIVPAEGTNTGISLSHACEQLLARSNGDVTPYVRSLAHLNSKFVLLLAESRRFGSATLHSYVDVVDKSKALQFAALQVDLPNGETYVSFRGTDSTLVGWREDFMLSFTVTEAQRRAALYLERAARRAAKLDRLLRVGGHSKGGNLAIYAATCCSEEVRDHILRVYSNDGPGMAPEITPTSGWRIPSDRLRRIVPTYSVIGMLFARATDPRMIVVSDGAGFGQHDPTTWQVTRSGIDEARELLPDCVVLNKAIANWTEGVPLDERERVVGEVFDALASGGATRFDEIASSPEALQQVLRALGNADERTRDAAVALVQSTVSTSVGAAKKAAQDTLDQWGRNMRVAAEGAARKIYQAGTEMLKRNEARIEMPRGSQS